MSSQKAEVRELLVQRDLDGLLAWAGATRNPQRILFSLTFAVDELIKWRAIEAVGRVAGVQAGSDIQKVRDFIRRLLWLMNDESGGLGWHAPESIGEILVNVPALVNEYAGLLPAYLREEPFQRGVHHAVYRVASVNHKPFTESIPKLGESLTDPDPAIRGYAALTLETMGVKSYRSTIEKLQDDHSPVSLYDFDTGQLQDTTVGRLI